MSERHQFLAQAARSAQVGVIAVPLGNLAVGLGLAIFAAGLNLVATTSRSRSQY
jgi:hypothetical protein